jgi:hypothetical protein
MAKLKLVEVMARSKFLRFDGTNILKYDLSNLEHQEDIAKVFNYFSGTVERMPEKSMLCLLDLTGLNEKVISVEEMSRDTERHAPYFRAVAVIASDSSAIDLTKAVRTRLGIYLPIFQEEKAAVDWLLSL